jgi:hypothetical protein
LAAVSRARLDPAPAHAAALTIGLKGRRIDTLSCRGRAGAGQEGQDLADGAFPPVRFGQRAVCLDVVAVAAFCDVQAGRDVTQAPPGSWATSRITRAWVVRKVQLVTVTGY